MERENIRVRTMAGREQKAREGKWNGGFAPYGYRLENGELVIAEDEVEIIQMIFDRYIHTNDGINGVANYLNNHGYTKKLRQNGTIPGFSSSFIKKIIDSPVYMGKIAYGRRRTEKKTGTNGSGKAVICVKCKPLSGGANKNPALNSKWTIWMSRIRITIKNIRFTETIGCSI